MPQSCIKYTIIARGNTESDRGDAVAEAMRLIMQGNLSGHNSNDSGGFYFDSTQEVPEGQQPA